MFEVYSPVGAIENELLEEKWNQCVFSRKVGTSLGQQGKTYGSVSEVNRVHAAVWFVF